MSKKKEPTKPVEPTNEEPNKVSVVDFLKEIKSQINIIKPQVELAELKARHAKANWENLEYTYRLNSLTSPNPDPKQEVQESEDKPDAIVREMQTEENVSEQTQ